LTFLGFLLKVSCATSDTNIFENLYHHNATIRTEAVAYLAQNFTKISISGSDTEILKLSIAERLNDENPAVFLEVLNIETSQLVELLGADELVAKLSKTFMRFWKSPEKWQKALNRGLQLMTSDKVFQCSDTNIVMISMLPFLFPSDDEASQVAYRIVKDSKYGKSLDFIGKLSKTVEDPVKHAAKVIEALQKSSKLPSSASVLDTIDKILIENEKIGSISVQFSFHPSCSRYQL
jgi:hypothetical protein